jgi:hypothetical protein
VIVRESTSCQVRTVGDIEENQPEYGPVFDRFKP